MQKSFRSTFLELQKEYLQTILLNLNNIESFFETKNIKEIKKEFHQLKGSGKTYDIEEISILSSLVEELCLKECVDFEQIKTPIIELLKKIIKSHTLGRPISLTKEEQFQKISAQKLI